ncbi:hydroxyacylglutathione hydrolase [Sediminicurvatus halobius]|uniref:Hydroxyacylglutathione hydrolase n=1 Tax=Sediminicurvatus halobius TaxID=2182432 RepID=A0A2U2N5Z3_9GAMM|nr:hydroxyacylglutathione hydrolase [Spiribacter halobius]PWG64596.1 hydroxyacylglutathione hydrolase [Spiribacter halobius]UEX79081.1 hydroxyacylglutathione hydrolase [Spiribacter halobius]
MLEITPIPLLRDNYAWLLRESEGTSAVVVDPGEAAPVRRALEAMGATLTGILITHHHPDHVGGVAELAGGDVPVLGPADETIPARTRGLQAGERFAAPGLTTELEVLAVPGHTAGHIAFLGDGVLFSGDSLFAGGCGRLFEGTPAQMLASLAALRELPEDTRLYCGHEYTLANLEFARAVEPDNQALAERLERVREQRGRGGITLPSRLGEEFATNPFLRWDRQSVIESAEAHTGRRLASAEEVFAAIRAWKDRF